MRFTVAALALSLGCSAPRLSPPSPALAPPPAPIADAAAPEDVPVASDAVADAPPVAPAASVTLTLPDGGVVTLTREHPEHTLTAALGPSAGGVADTRFHMEDGADPFHYRENHAGARLPDYELTVPAGAPSLALELSGGVAQLHLSAAGAAGPAVCVTRDPPDHEAHAAVGGGGRVSVAALLHPPDGRMTVSPCSLRAGRGPVTLRVALSTPTSLPDPGASQPAPRRAFASFSVTDAGDCEEGHCERWFVQLRGAVRRRVPAGRAVPSWPLHSAHATFGARNAPWSFDASTSSESADVYGWRVRRVGGAYVVEQSVANGPWRRVGGFGVPAGVALEPDPDGVVQSP